MSLFASRSLAVIAALLLSLVSIGTVVSVPPSGAVAAGTAEIA